MPKLKPGTSKTSKPEAFEPVYGRVKQTARMFGIGTSQLYELINKGLVESFLLTDKPGAKMGARLIKLDSLRRYFEAEAAKAAKAAKKPSPVSVKGREALAAKRAKEKAEKEAALA
jgi:hypothetical protein